MVAAQGNSAVSRVIKIVLGECLLSVDDCKNFAALFQCEELWLSDVCIRMRPTANDLILNALATAK